MAIRCLCPPLRRTPRSPTSVACPSGKALDDDDGQDKHPVLRGARHVLRHVLHHALHRVLHVSCDSRGCINKCPSCAGVYDYFQQHIFDKNEKAGADYYQGRGTPAYGVKLGWTNAFSDG